MKKLVLVLLLLAVPKAARADFGIGFFLGDPTGFDMKIGIGHRSALDIVLGLPRYRDYNDFGYAHLTWLGTLWVGQGDAVVVPLRLGVGVAVFGNRGDVGVGVRAPFEVGVRFRRVPIEIYGEVALLLTAVDPYERYPDRYHRFELQGGVGMRFYF